MATIPFAEFGGGIVRVEFDVSDANRRVQRGRCINNSDHDALITVLSNGSAVYQVTAAAGQTITQNIAGWTLPQQPDYWNSVTGQYEPDGVDMGSYVVQVRWPA